MIRDQWQFEPCNHFLERKIARFWIQCGACGAGNEIEFALTGLPQTKTVRCECGVLADVKCLSELDIQFVHPNDAGE